MCLGDETAVCYFHVDITHRHVVPLTLKRTVMSTELKHLIKGDLGPRNTSLSAGLMDP